MLLLKVRLTPARDAIAATFQSFAFAFRRHSTLLTYTSSTVTSLRSLLEVETLLTDMYRTVNSTLTVSNATRPPNGILSHTIKLRGRERREVADLIGNTGTPRRLFSCPRTQSTGSVCGLCGVELRGSGKLVVWRCSFLRLLSPSLLYSTSVHSKRTQKTSSQQFSSLHRYSFDFLFAIPLAPLLSAP